MIIYVESNFVLELALLQHEHAACSAIVDLCQSGKARLVVPAYCLVEPFETITRRHKARRALTEQLESELKQLLRTEPYRQRETSSREILALLAGSADEEMLRLQAVVRDVLSLAEVIPLTPEIVETALHYQFREVLGPQDAVVYTSVFTHLSVQPSGPSCFVNRNRKDFDQPKLAGELESRGCKMLYNFEVGIGYLTSQFEKP